ncbi:phage regulatory protein, partial [Clostridiaceae bacterium]|nr:phage regulatory protein [Clostridiaceae bacterium]
MNGLRKATITTLEVAEMMEVAHSDLLKKIEGRKDRKGYIQILNEGQMSVVDFLHKSFYVDAKGEERPCYEVTRMGCDFLANKSTGEKGVI